VQQRPTPAKPVKTDELHISGSPTMEEFVSIHSSLESSSDSQCTNEAFLDDVKERKNTLNEEQSSAGPSLVN